MIYNELTSFETLYQAYLTARKCKRKKTATAEYEANALACTDKLSRKLRAHRYRPGGFRTFHIYEPKIRLVQAPAFVDKVVLHAVTDNVLYDAVTKGFVRDNCASQNGKGTQYALMRLKLHLAQFYRRYQTADGWVLKCDIHHFFASINHEILKGKLRALFERRGVDPEVYELLCIYIDSTEGLPLGYQTSQLFALLMLDGMDHFIQEERGFRLFGRGMDDFYVIARTKSELQELLAEIRKFVGALELELNGKTNIFPLRNGLDFLGFHSYLTDTGAVIQKLRRANVQRMRKKIKRWRKEYPAGKIEKAKILEAFQGWDAFAAYGDTYSLRRKFAAEVSQIISEPVRIHRKINSTRAAREARRKKQQRCIERKAQRIRDSMQPRPLEVPPWN